MVRSSAWVGFGGRSSGAAEGVAQAGRAGPPVWTVVDTVTLLVRGANARNRGRLALARHGIPSQGLVPGFFKRRSWGTRYGCASGRPSP
ncbi:hypothetical protein GCM10010505_55120 [Kitasatospora aburaviensis]